MKANIFNNPNLPVVNNPTPRQQATFDGYIMALLKNEGTMAFMQEKEPLWLPGFELTPLAIEIR